MNVELLCVIVDFGIGSKVLHVAKENGVTGGTFLVGKGTFSNKFLDFIGLSDIRKEIVLMVAPENILSDVVVILNDIFKFEKPNRGIMFTIPIMAAIGMRYCSKEITLNRNGDETMYDMITTIVDQGKAEFVMAAASKAGSKGGTIINGRGSGIHETTKLFNMEIEPEKDIVIILSEADKTAQIVESIRTELKIDEPGNGIIYVQNVKQTFGIYR